jgi:hypothetical protein
VTNLLQRAGVADADEVSTSIAAMIGGTAMNRQVSRVSEWDEARALTRAIRDLVAARLLGVEVIEKALATLHPVTV